MPHFVVYRWNGDSYEDYDKPIVGVFPTFQQARDCAIHNIQDVLTHFYHRDEMDESFDFKDEDKTIDQWSWNMHWSPDPEYPDEKPYPIGDYKAFDKLPETINAFVSIDVWEGEKRIHHNLQPEIISLARGKKVYLAATVWNLPPEAE